MVKTKKEPLLIGWREWVGVPDLCEGRIKAKIDTGARTSALHAFGLRIVERGGVDMAEFEVHPLQRSVSHSTKVSYRVHSFKNVRSSTGHSERRPVIKTSMDLGGRRYQIELTLTSRDEMGFRMLLGRSAIRRRFIVDPGGSFLLTKPSTNNRGTQ